MRSSAIQRVIVSKREERRTVLLPIVERFTRRWFQIFSLNLVKESYLLRLMTEDALKFLSLDDLLQFMELTINEFLAMKKTNENEIRMKQKQKEVELINKVIIAKKAETLSRSNATY